jgi:hypothetical protein
VSAETFGRLTVIGAAPSVGHRRMVLCRCVCGAVKPMPLWRLRSGHTKSCGCLRRTLFDHTRHHGYIKVDWPDGSVLPLAEAARRAGKSYLLVYRRIKQLGWSHERALTLPVRGTAHHAGAHHSVAHRPAA